MTPVEVLMVEDNRGDVVLLKEAMQRAGLNYTLNVACDGVEAMDYLQRQGRYAGAARPDLILLDLKLPRKTGMEVLDAIESDSKLHDIPIVVLSSSSSELSLVRVRRNPPCCCMVKPGSFDGYIEIAQTIDVFRKAQQKKENNS